MKANKLIIQAFALILLFQLIDSKSTFDITSLRTDPLKVLSEDIKWLIPVRVKRSAIVYNRCPLGYKRLPPPINCMRCDFAIVILTRKLKTEMNHSRTKHKQATHVDREIPNRIKGANERREHRGDQRHPWTSATPEELPMRCRPLRKWYARFLKVPK
ncbi:hypothetical protein RR46_11428 [Papilio xuthus]|uniref:Uncharacterized protein n=1 Tax=Papilio xuthus TaxID=66420 RepID=A0A194PX46_PAPXU|nr:hypothetical protein RR46_11428 [Papilio xuthus]